jgi:hypothetical protein
MTVIACCLLYLCFVSRPQIVHAQGQEHVFIDGVSPDAYLSAIIAGVREDFYHPFAVPVTIRSAAQNVPVSVMNVGGQDLPPGVIPVANALAPGGAPYLLQVKQR